MHVKRTVTPMITIGDQPSENDLKTLKDEGFVGVVNLRNDGEPEQPLSTKDEGDHVRALGMEYLHHGVGGTPLSDQGVKSVSDFLNHHATGKVLVHCRKGGRAVALVLLHEARSHHWKPEEVFEKGKALGLVVEGGLKSIVEDYLRAHPPGH